MLQLLRFMGLLVVAVWLGAAVFLTFGVGPAFFSKAMLDVMPRYHAGRAAQIVLESYFLFQVVCAGLTMLLLLAEWAWAARPPRRWLAGLVVTLAALVLFGGTVVQPQLRSLHTVMYAPDTTDAQKESARRSFGRWHGVSQAGNLVILLGVVVCFWQLAMPAPARPAGKYTGIVA